MRDTITHGFLWCEAQNGKICFSDCQSCSKGDTAHKKSAVYKWFSGFTMDRRHWRMTSTVAGLQNPELKK
jgi:hypothetical protein